MYILTYNAEQTLYYENDFMSFTVIFVTMFKCIQEFCIFHKEFTNEILKKELFSEINLVLSFPVMLFKLERIYYFFD